MYRPPYVCCKFSFENAIFRRIFFSGRFKIWSLLQPEGIMLKFLQEDGKVIYGSNMFSNWKEIEIRNKDRFIVTLKGLVKLNFCIFLYFFAKQKSREYFYNVIKGTAMEFYVLETGKTPKNKDEAFKFLESRVLTSKHYFETCHNFTFFEIFSFFSIIFRVFKTLT